MKDIVILANFAGTLTKTDNNRFPYIAQMLAKENEVELITSDFEHQSKVKRAAVSHEYDFKITMLNELPYSKNVCLKRFISHASFGRSVSKYLEKRKKPDVIYCAVPSLDAAWVAAKFAKKNKIRFIVDIQDLWPEAFKMVLNVPIISNLIFKPMEIIANKIYAQADEIVAVSKTYGERALKVNRKSNAAYTVFLGTNIQEFDENASRKNNIKKDKILLGYCGTLGSSYDLICVIDALSTIKNKGIDSVQFIVMGDGPRRAEFEKYAYENNIDILFTGRLAYADMCSVLCNCDIVVNPISKGAAQSIINKHADYAASGLPVLNTQECEEYRNLVEEYDMGFNCKNNDAKDLAEKLLLLVNDEALRLKMGLNARRCAEERFNRDGAYQLIVRLICGE